MDRRQFTLTAASAALGAAQTGAPRKIKDITIYSDDLYYCAFPSIVRRANGELICAFRRAPNRRIVGVSRYSHTDPNSYCVLVRSRDNGQTWSKDPELIFAHPLGGSQDPCLLQLQDGTLLCTSYLWVWLDKERGAKTQATTVYGQYAYAGGYVVRSTDGGRTWQGPLYPPPVPGRAARDIFGKPLPAYNRGGLYQGRDGRVFWVVAYPKGPEGSERSTDIHLMISNDGGQSWKYSCPVASDDKVTFNETSIYETPKGDLVAFVRTADFDDHTVIARSRDGGKSFEKWQDAGWQGHPHHAVRLPDNRVFLVYGYRHKPYGIRARVLNAECTDFATAPEIVLRDDGGNGDLGYPWAVVLPNRQVLAVYYMNHNDGLRYIGGTLVAV